MTTFREIKANYRQDHPLGSRTLGDFLLQGDVSHMSKTHTETMKRRQFISTSVTGLVLAESFLSLDTVGQSPEPRAIINKINKRPLKPAYVKPPERDFRSGAKIRFEQTNNQFSTWERVVHPKEMGPPPHLHKDLDEIMRVISGTVAVLVGDEVTYVEEGAWHLRPHGVKHTFWNEGDVPARVVEIYPNQNFEVYLELLNNLITDLGKNGTPTDSREAKKRIDKLDREWGIVTFHDERQAIAMKYGLL
jgi:mannose-6-phosphate isomerase-like protein (cupin superfamily)